eukprot:CAMPEP_0180780976 /NCGR_PEP_ID=MMETSP1038_2-20121128/47351_1 /TAXON_ID=632150 /ORGANISM="Azadinium spinosum, Strain 3D9" /LENGTH=34 /DNA_ID= /DNA_START= /DNA_END= /DNA_ORIENTATION=
MAPDSQEAQGRAQAASGQKRRSQEPRQRLTRQGL